MHSTRSIKSATAPASVSVRRNLGRGADCSSAYRRASNVSESLGMWEGCRHCYSVPPSFPFPLDFFESRVEVRDQIVRVLDAHRNANQGVGDSEAIAGLLGHAGMGRTGGMRYQRFRAAETHSQLDHLQGVEETK